jgi:hypothetical protein
MPQSWDMGQIILNFPFERRHAENFYTRNIQLLRPGLKRRTWEPEASMLTTRPRKPFPGGKAGPGPGSGRDADPSPTSSAEVKNSVELYIYSH